MCEICTSKTYYSHTPETRSCVPPLTCAVLVSSPVFVAVDLGPGASLGMITRAAPAASLVLGGNDQTGQGQTLQTSYPNPTVHSSFESTFYNASYNEAILNLSLLFSPSLAWVDSIDLHKPSPAHILIFRIFILSLFRDAAEQVLIF